MLETLITLILIPAAVFVCLVLARFITDWVREVATNNDLMHEIEGLERTVIELRKAIIELQRQRPR